MAAKLMRGIVARGRTVMAPHPTQRRTVPDADGRPVERSVLAEYGPGAEIELPADEIVGLRKAGYLIDTAQPEFPLGNGPRFDANANSGPVRLEAAAE